MKNELEALRDERYALQLKSEYQWFMLQEQFDHTVNSIRPSVLIKSALLRSLEAPVIPNDILESLIASLARFIAHKTIAAWKK
ncbi:MAG: hypothetical protein ACK4WD_03935 [Flavobacteriales bacterium]|jgi:hypothetical protein